MIFSWPLAQALTTLFFLGLGERLGLLHAILLLSNFLATTAVPSKYIGLARTGISYFPIMVVRIANSRFNARCLVPVPVLCAGSTKTIARAADHEPGVLASIVQMARTMTAASEIVEIAYCIAYAFDKSLAIRRWPMALSMAMTDDAEGTAL